VIPSNKHSAMWINISSMLVISLMLSRMSVMYKPMTSLRECSNSCIG